jgi:LPXTG-motif cell wall-anchored protein
MRVVRTIVPLLLAALTVGLPATAASADEYPPPPPTLTATPGTVIVGSTVTVTGTNYGPNDLVTLFVSTDANAAPAPADAEYVPVAYSAAARVQVQADANGSFTTFLTLHQVGLATITGVGSPSGRSASTTVRVLPLAKGLPVTGPSTNYAGLALAGSAVAAVGVLLLVLARSRRQRHSATR